MKQSIIAAVSLAASHIPFAESYATPRNVGISPLTGCGKPLPRGQAVGRVSNITISSGGLQRSYLVSIPPTYNEYIPTPLIISYHGGSRNASSQLQLDELTSPEFNTVSMVVYPQGVNVRFSFKG